MHRNTLAFVIVAALGGFVAGFWLANSLNRSAGNAINAVPTQSSTSAPGQTQDPLETELSPDELRAKIAEADQNPSNFTFQKDLGTSLYRYAATKQDPTLLEQARRLLTRADTLNSKDFDVLVALGHAHFDIGFHKRDAVSFQKAREVYTRALAIRPDDPDIKTDLGLTYFLQEPPDYDKAAAQLTRVSTDNPRHDRSLQFLVRTFVKQGKLADAEKALEKIKSINPGNPAITELTTQIADARKGVSG
ncbi:MAG TPA: tetratricopeptide repeat protein [Pyrinomonadaceae bacterium]|nr:tetratricopeptide repeat protein [Pyrinomonadaceae bacterium]